MGRKIAWRRWCAVLAMLSALMAGSRVPCAAQQAPIVEIANLHLSNLCLSPEDIQITWTQLPLDFDQPGPGPSDQSDTVGIGVGWSGLYRSPTGAAFPAGGTWDGMMFASYDDADWQLNTRYAYYLTGTDNYWTWAPPYTDSSNTYHSGSWTLHSDPCISETIYVTVRKVGVAANQTVDTRMDMRYDIPPLVNHQFANTLYRGGLFSGFNQDGSQVARTYLKFSGLAGPMQSGDTLWPVGGLEIYSTRLTKSGSANLVCRAATSNNWDPGTLVWANAPPPVNYGGGGLTVSWDSANPIEQWLTMNVTSDLQQVINSGSGTMSLVVMAADESGSGTATTASPGWTYFARGSYLENNVSMGAYLLYAFGGPGAPIIQDVQLSPTSVTNVGDTVNGTVDLAGSAPSSGVVVALSSSDPSVTVPTTVTIAAGQMTANFTATCAQTKAQDTPVTITATLEDGSQSATITVKASGGQ